MLPWNTEDSVVFHQLATTLHILKLVIVNHIGIN
jgi:hypothetical protein